MHAHSALDPTFLGSFKRLFSQKGCYIDLDMTRRVDWLARRTPLGSTSFLDEPATKPPTCDLTIFCPELRALCSRTNSSSSYGETGDDGDADPAIWTLRIRQTRTVSVRDVLAHLDRFLYAEVPAAYWPEDPKEQERIECAHQLRVKHLARTHGRSARAGARMSFSSPGQAGGLRFGGAPLCFMQVVECAEVDEYGRMVKRDRKVAPRIDWLGGKFYFAGLKRSEEGEYDFVLNMEGPWARRRRSLI